MCSGNARGGLAAARQLTRAGWSVSAATVDTRGLLAWSRMTRMVFHVPPPERDLDAFIAATSAAIESSGSELVLPGSDAELVALSRERARIDAVVPLADDAIVRRSIDKLEVVRAAVKVGMRAPTTVPASREALARAAYPVVVKSRFHWLPEHGGAAPSRLDAAVCRDLGSATAYAEEMRRRGGEPLLQEVVEGDPVNVHVVTDRAGAVVSMLQQDSARLFYPPGAGVRVRSVVVPLDSSLADGIPLLMRELGWFGFAGLAFLRGADGIPRLIDFNGRIPSNLEASAGAGLDCMTIWTALATNRPLPPIPAPTLGKRFQVLETDLRRALHERRGGLLRDIVGTLAYAPGAQHTVTKWDDPLVVVRYSVRLLLESRYARKLLRTRTGR